MPARSLCQKFFRDALAPLHAYRKKSLVDATSAVINGASLTLTSIGRYMPGHAHVKHKIKRADRLLGNRRLQEEVPLIFSLITRRMILQMSRVFILVDWSSYHCEAFQLLRASLACDGRSLPLMSQVVPKALQGNPDVHEQFFSSLSRCLKPGTDVIIIADSGFHGRWFRQINQRGWSFISRIQGNHYYRTSTEWEKVSDAGNKATDTPQYLGDGILGRNKCAQHAGYFYLYKQKDKGRSGRSTKERKRRTGQEMKSRASAKAPWLIFTNTTEYSAKQVMKIYSRRMQIEQNFRDEKSTRYGFGLRDGGSRTTGRLSVLSLIATLASIIMWLSGYCFENKGLHRRYQANTTQNRRVISLLTLAENVLRHSPELFARISLDKSLRLLIQRNTSMVLVY